MSIPNKSLNSVYSHKLIRVNLFPVAAANAEIKDVLPTPGSPSNKIDLYNYNDLRRRCKLIDVVGEENEKEKFDGDD